MTTQPNAVTSTRRAATLRTRRSFRAHPILAAASLGALAALLAACGSSSSASPTSSSSGAATSGSGNGAPRQFPGASGTIAAVNGTSMEVQNPSTGQTTVSYTSGTTFRQIVSSDASSVTVGSCISAFGKPTSGSSSSSGVFGEPITASTVSVTQSVSGSCTAGFGARFGGGGAPPSGSRTTFGTGTRPPGANRPRNGQFGGANGQVTAVNVSAVTVQETNPRTNKSSSVVVTLTSTTTYTTSQSASPSALVVGQCARAVGGASSSGAITARSITVSSPGANGCTGGFGGFRGGPGGGAGSDGPGGAVTTGA
jgi:hypothetical protein